MTYDITDYTNYNHGEFEEEINKLNISRYNDLSRMCLIQYAKAIDELPWDPNLQYWLVKQLSEDDTLSRCVIIVRITNKCCMQLYTYKPFEKHNAGKDSAYNQYINDDNELQKEVEKLALDENFQYILAYPGPDEYDSPTFYNGLNLFKKGFRVVLPRSEWLSCEYLIQNNFFEKEAIRRSRVFQGDELLEQFVTDELSVDLQNADDKLREKYWAAHSVEIIKDLLNPPTQQDGTYNILINGKTQSVSPDNITTTQEYSILFNFKIKMNNIFLRSAMRPALLCKTLLENQPYVIAYITEFRDQKQEITLIDANPDTEQLTTNDTINETDVNTTDEEEIYELKKDKVVYGNLSKIYKQNYGKVPRKIIVAFHSSK